jgi:hypothetical protein
MLKVIDTYKNIKVFDYEHFSAQLEEEKKLAGDWASSKGYIEKDEFGGFKRILKPHLSLKDKILREWEYKLEIIEFTKD